MHTDKIFIECRPQCIYSSMTIRGPATGPGAAHARPTPAPGQKQEATRNDSETARRGRAGADSEVPGDVLRSRAFDH